MLNLMLNRTLKVQKCKESVLSLVRGVVRESLLTDLVCKLHVILQSSMRGTFQFSEKRIKNIS
jgi:hypothetical protein